MIDPLGPILTHGAVENVNEVLRGQGIDLPPTIRVTPETDPAAYPGALVLATPSALSTPWARRFGPASSAFASGWMALRGVRRRRAADRGFVVSDHADWAGLNEAIRATGASRILVTHGYTASFRRWLEDQGYRRRDRRHRIRGRGLRVRRGRRSCRQTRRRSRPSPCPRGTAAMTGPLILPQILSGGGPAGAAGGRRPPASAGPP